MRAVVVLIAAAGCAHAPVLVSPGAEVEIIHDEGRASERPLTPGRTFEMLVAFDPRMSAYRPLRVRFALAQPGPIVFTVYATGPDGLPGEALKTISREYGPELASTADDGKWVTEDLSDVAVQHGPIFIGLYGPVKSADARLWATSNDSKRVFQRDVDPARPLAPLPRTPRLRLTVTTAP